MKTLHIVVANSFFSESPAVQRINYHWLFQYCRRKNDCKCCVSDVYRVFSLNFY